MLFFVVRFINCLLQKDNLFRTSVNVVRDTFQQTRALLLLPFRRVTRQIKLIRRLAYTPASLHTPKRPILRNIKRAEVNRLAACRIINDTRRKPPRPDILKHSKHRVAERFLQLCRQLCGAQVAAAQAFKAHLSCNERADASKALQHELVDPQIFLRRRDRAHHVEILARQRVYLVLRRGRLVGKAGQHLPPYCSP